MAPRGTRGGRKARKARQRKELQVVHPNAAGIDIGASFHMVAVPVSRADQPVQRFGSVTAELKRLCDWLSACEVTTVAMESTGVYWIPLYELLCARGFAVLLVNAHHVKNVPGRKSDVSDCQWLQQLHSYGLLRGSFRPDDAIVPLRSYLRQRDTLLRYAAAHVQHMQKALCQMNVKLAQVVSDITGQTGMAIIRAIVSGEHDPNTLAQHRHERCHASQKDIIAALEGTYRAEHLFELSQALELYQTYQSKIQDCDAQIEAVLRKLGANGPGEDKPLPPARSKLTPQSNQPTFDVRQRIFEMVGVDLSQIHGIGPYTALQLIAEIGTDMSAWPTEHHFTSWATLAPKNKITGGKRISSKTQTSANRVAAKLRLAARSAGRTQTAIGAFYRRLSARVGKAKAITATARKLAVLVYRALRDGLTYLDPGADAYDQRHKSRVVRSLRIRAKNLGYQLVSIEQLANA